MHLDATLLSGSALGAAQLGIAIVALLPDQPHGAGDLLVAEAAAQQGTKVVAVRGEKAQVELPFGGKPGSVAVAAEGLCDAGDQAVTAITETVRKI